MSLSIADLRAAIELGISADPRLAPMTYEQGLYRPMDSDALPMVQLAITSVPAEQVARDLAERVASVEMHIIREGGSDVEDQAELDARASEAVVLAAFSGQSDLIRYELQGWELQTSDDASPRAIRTIVSASAGYYETFNAA